MSNEEAKIVLAKFDSKCRECNCQIMKGEKVYWKPGVKGVWCWLCGEDGAATLGESHK